jgi:hypothetical protein
MCRVRGDRVVRMDGSDGDEAGHTMTAAEMAQEAKNHLDKFLAAPYEENAHSHLARAAAMSSAAISRCAREAESHAKIASGRGLLG